MSQKTTSCISRWRQSSRRRWGLLANSAERSSRGLQLERLEPRVVLDGSAIITEFMAINDSGVADEDGDVVDWIEIYNPTQEPVDLQGWFLTDNSGNLNKWEFPTQMLAGGGYLLVYASGKDRATPEMPLHTNFLLSGSGEYLALVQPDEKTVASEFTPSYPAQAQDVSYGLNTQIEITSLLSDGDTARYLVPTGEQDWSADWNTEEFDDSSWSTGATGIGFDQGDSELELVSGSILAAQPVGYWRFNEISGAVAENLGTFGSSINGTYTGGPSQTLVGPRPPLNQNFEDDNTGTDFDGINDYVTTGQSLLSNVAAFTMMAWIRPGAITANRVGLFGQNDAIEFGFISPNTIQIWTPGGGNLNVNHSMYDNQWHHLATTGDGSNLRVYIDGSLVGTGGSTTGNYGGSSFPFNIGGGGVYDDGSSQGNWFTGGMDEVAVFHRALTLEEIQAIASASAGTVDYAPLIQSDIEAAMFGVNSSVLMRSEFTVGESTEFDQLLLDIRADDGFVAYLNGQEVARLNAPEPAEWNSQATDLNPDTQAAEFTTYDISEYRDFLNVGGNVLAIHGLNIEPDNTDFLLSAELKASSATLTAKSRYFSLPTPGEPNGTGVEDLGPIFARQTFSPRQPTATDPVLVTVDVAESFHPLNGVDMHYRVMFGQTITVAMSDDGANGDAMAGDGTYTAEIPAGAAAPGEMLRWYFTSQDDQSNASRWPLFAVDSGIKQSPEYFGTVASDPNLVDDVPILQMFLANPGAEQTRGGARASLYYNGEFYDNIFVRQRGGSTTSSPKDSLKIELNAGEHFRYDPEQSRVEEFNLNTTYSDKAYIRQNLSFEAYAEVGNPSSVSFPMRLEQNGNFHSLAVFIEQPDDDMLRREGLDPDGALYKMFNQFTSGSSGVEKKTRRYEDNSDLISFVNNINSLSGGALRAYVFDNVDIPAVLNYLSGTVLVHQNDHPHKNHYLYRDTNGTGEWLFIPWDHDLTLGSNWVGTSFSDTIYADDDSVPGRPAAVKPSHPFIGAANYQEWNVHWNRLTDKLLSVPLFREMYLRRLRSTMDQILQASSTPGNLSWLDMRLNELETQVQVSAQLDYQRWANPWQWGSNQNPAQAIDVIRNDYLPRRRTHLYVNHLVGNNYPFNAGIPLAQEARPQINFGDLDYNPASGNQDQEYIQLVNPNSAAVDISGWKLRGGVDYEFKPGVVIPGGRSLFVTPDAAQFRARTSGPSGNRSLFVQGGYNGHLSNFGETIRLLAPDSTEVSSISYEGEPSLPQQFLRISEINYNPAAPSAEEMAMDSTLDNDDFEYIELINTSDAPLDLQGVNFSSGVRYTFGAVSLPPGERIVVVKDQAAFEIRYGQGVNVAGEFLSGSLDNGGELLKLDDATNSTIQEVDYNDSGDWPLLADGGGSSLEVVSPDLYQQASDWRASAEYGGTPGAEGAGPSITVIINEVLTHTDPPQVDTVELYNTTGAEIDLGNWYLSDSIGDFRKYQFPVGTMLPAGGYLTVDETDFNSSMGLDPRDFALDGAHGDPLYLLAVDENGRPSRFVHDVEFSAAANGESFGMWPDADGVLYPMISFTPGEANSGPRVGPVVISEVQYNPLGAGQSDDDFEFVEIYNPSDTAINLTNWRIRGGVDYDFDADEILEPSSTLVILSFEPGNMENNARVQAFREKYGIDETVRLVGGYASVLANDGESVRLERPDEPPLDEPDFIPRLLEDEVVYSDQGSWPAVADGEGASLGRRLDARWGHDASSWYAGQPTPGRVLTSTQVTFVDLNGDADPPDLAVGPQPTNWTEQRSDLASLVLHFNQGMQLSESDLTLTNLGVNAPVDADIDFQLSGHVTVDGNLVTLRFGQRELDEGVYRLTVNGSITDTNGERLDGNGDGVPGDAYVLSGNRDNKFYRLAADWNGDGGVTIFDFPTFSYWFGKSTIAAPFAPSYLDLNGDDGVTIFDFPAFADNFGKSVTFPAALAPAALLREPSKDPIESESGEEMLDQQLADRVFSRVWSQPKRWNSPQTSGVGQSARETLEEEVLEDLVQDIANVWRGR